MKRDDAHAVADRQFERLVFFSDAVFAIAITLLVLDLRPEAANGDPPSLEASGPKVLSFVIGFYVIARYWLAHHALFGELRREDRWLRLASLCFLAGIVFLPFPTGVLIESRATTQSVIFFALSAGLVGVLFCVLTCLSLRPAVRGAAGIPTMRRVLLEASGAPLVFAASIPLALLSFRLGMASWLAVTPVQLALSAAARRTGRSRAGDAAGDGGLDP